MEVPVLAVLQAGGDAVEAPAADAMAVCPLEIIDLGALDLPDNDKGIYEAMLERMLGEPEVPGVEASESAAPVAVTSAEAGEPTDEEPALDATAAGQLMPGVAGVIGAPETSTTSEAAKELLGEPATSTKLTLVTSSPLAAVVDSTAVRALESPSL
jgi:hypothetical protein